jgi:adenylate cyclase
MEHHKNVKNMRKVMAKISSVESEKNHLQGMESDEWMTFLFCSIDGYMALAEKMETQDLIKLLNDYLSIVVELVLEHEGMIDKFTGDKAFACWGIPVVSPNQELLA